MAGSDRSKSGRRGRLPSLALLLDAIAALRSRLWGSVSSTRRIWGGGRVKVEKPGVRGVARSVTIPVAIVCGRAMRGPVFAAR